MATTATISIASDIMSSFGGITETMTLTQAGTTTDIDSTTGFQIRKLSATSTVDLMIRVIGCLFQQIFMMLMQM